MTAEQRAALESEKADLTRKADKRRNEPGYGANVKAIEARLAEIEAELAAGD